MPFRNLLLLAAGALALGACSTPRTVLEAELPPLVVAELPPRAPMPAPPAVLDYDTVRAGRFDNGRMFTLDDPPRAYFAEQYGFEPDQAWFDRARLGALRFATYCSASFVSADGLVLTNHHCARQSITQVGLEAGQDFVTEGFYARSPDEERRVEGLFVEQLEGIEDVTDRVNAAAASATTDQERQQARAAAVQQMQAAMTEAAGPGRRVQVISFYAGGQYKAYTFRRYDDVRLAFAPELALGYFGGDPDNFTYPRYSLDFALLRVYGDDGRPLRTDHYFRFQPSGSRAGDLVFVIGNPGSTTRLQTVAQLEFRRDFTEPAILRYLETRERVFGDFIAANPDAPETPELTDTFFSLGNGRKAYTGRVAGLRDPYVIARRRAAERDFQAALAQNPAAQAEFGDVIDRIAANRQEARATGHLFGIFVGYGPGAPYTSAAEGRALAYVLGGGQADEERLLGIEDQPRAIQEGLLRARLEDVAFYLGAESAEARAILDGRSPAAIAQDVIARSALATAEGTRAALAARVNLAGDPAVQLVQRMVPLLQRFQQANQALGAELAELQTRLARARFEVYGTSIPPDATFSLRISDGVVRGYEYNGTLAPPYTTAYGLFDRFHSHCELGGQVSAQGVCDWALPPRWQDARSRLRLATPFNFVSTNDIIGGNSGSPVLNRNLEVVGIAFDGNIESLPGDYIFDDTRNRTVSLDVRMMLEAIETVYGLDALARELRQGRR
ncbi:MAG: S46 family peptidase [Rubricoccaceae bacterium]